jgi:hypothetical protein
MLLPIRTQYTKASYQNAVNKNNTVTAAESSFSKALSQAADSLEETSQSNISGGSSEKRALIQTDMMSIIKDKIREMQIKLENGETEPTFQIGGRTFTKKEWENLIHKVDKALEQNKIEIENESEKKNVNKTNPNDKEKTGKSIDDTELKIVMSLL